MSRLYRDDLVSKVAGKGRAPAIYKRSSNLLKQLVVEFEHPKPDTVSDTGLLKQDNLYGVSSGKVINEGKSDQSIDHFSEKPPTHTRLFEQSHRPDGAGDVCSNSENQSLSKIEQPYVENPEKSEEEDQTEWLYWSEAGTMAQVLKRTKAFVTLRVPGQRHTTKVPTDFFNDSDS